MKSAIGRVIVLGGTGFIGSNIADRLTIKGIEVIRLGSRDVDLLDEAAEKKLTKILRKNDILVLVSALAPCRDIGMFQKNLQMIQPIANALQSVQLSHLVYISSDAVYKDSATLINEESCAQPNSLHGAMHLAREIALKNISNCTITIIRPTLVYGVQDPHNGYGPNSFARLANQSENIRLYGQGEELRDHIAVEDVAEIVSEAIINKVAGEINAVSGDPVTFFDLASYISTIFNLKSGINYIDRQGAMPHNGYRVFNNSKLYGLFPNFKPHPWKVGIRKLCMDIKSKL